MKMQGEIDAEDPLNFNGTEPSYPTLAPSPALTRTYQHPPHMPLQAHDRLLFHPLAVESSPDHSLHRASHVLHAPKVPSNRNGRGSTFAIGFDCE